jgi:hypothetical protein
LDRRGPDKGVSIVPILAIRLSTLRYKRNLALDRKTFVMDMRQLLSRDRSMALASSIAEEDRGRVGKGD